MGKTFHSIRLETEKDKTEKKKNDHFLPVLVKTLKESNPVTGRIR